MNDDRIFSCEFFPPKTEAGMDKLLAVRNQLDEGMQPAFYSVTFGAGGTSRERTLHAVDRLREDGTLKPDAFNGSHEDIRCDEARDVREVLRAVARVHADGRQAVGGLTRADRVGDESRQQSGGDVVHAVIVEVLQHVERDALAGARQAADDDQSHPSPRSVRQRDTVLLRLGGVMVAEALLVPADPPVELVGE